MKIASIVGIEYYLPKQKLHNDDLVAQFPDWSVEKIAEKTGIHSRAIVSPKECSSDLAIAAAERLFESGIDRSEIDFVVLCTQSPDYFLPTTACIVQHKLGIPTTAGALDFNLGCSGYVYGLGLAKGLIESGQANRLLLLTAETYSKFLDPSDRSVRTIFGDAAAATVLSSKEADVCEIGPFVYGTDGSGAENLIVEGGAMRDADNLADPYLRMNGSEIFVFTLKSVPNLVHQTLEKASIEIGEIDWFVFHQANQFMIEHLRKKLEIPPEKFVVHLEDCGNTVSSSIPIALKTAVDDGRIKAGHKVMTVGFGVGYSWAATVIKWSGSA